MCDIKKIQNKLDAHIQEFRDHVEQEDMRWSQIIDGQEKNNVAISQLVECTKDLHESTSDVVEAWKTGTSVIKFGGMVGRFIKWLGGFAIVGGMIAWLSNHIKV